MIRLTLFQIAALLLLTLATPLLAETVKVHPLDHPVPPGIAEQLPADTPASEVFVTDDACYYLRTEAGFTFIGCIG